MIRPFAKRLLELYATRLPYHRGKWRVIENVLRFTGIEAPDRNRTFDVEREGVRWRLGTGCVVQRKLYYHGGFDVHDVRALFSRLPKDGVFFDIGSYFGYYALLAARRGARVFAFEPVPTNYALLATHQAMNHFDQLRTFQLALSDTAGRISFALPNDDNRGRGHIAAPGESCSSEVSATTLDAFAREHAIERLDALKLDVEGAELRVLAGARETLARFRPAMLIELNPPCLARFGASEADLLESVRSLGYETFRPTRGALVPFARLAPGEDYTNILCLAR